METDLCRGLQRLNTPGKMLVHVMPPFVGNDYFCESGHNTGGQDYFYPDDPLWDGQSCISSSMCCSLNTPPYSVKQLPTPTTDNIEARLCQLDTNYPAVEIIEPYLQRRVTVALCVIS